MITEFNSPIGTSINFTRLKRYHPDWTLDEIVVFEQLLVVRRQAKTWVFKAGTQWLMERLHMTRRRVEVALDKLIARELIEPYGEKKGVPLMYKIDAWNLARRVDKIWDLQAIEDKEERHMVRTEYKRFVVWFCGSYMKRKFNLVNINEDE